MARPCSDISEAMASAVRGFIRTLERQGMTPENARDAADTVTTLVLNRAVARCEVGGRADDPEAVACDFREALVAVGAWVPA